MVFRGLAEADNHKITIPLHKKGVYDDSDNFRGITLLSVPGKVLCRVVQNKSKDDEGEGKMKRKGILYIPNQMLHN